MEQQHYQIALSGLGCGKCVAKVTQAFHQQDPTAMVLINDDKSQAFIDTHLSAEQSLALIQALGYQAELMLVREFHDQISNVTCQKCVGRVRAGIQEIDADAEVSIDIPTQQLIALTKATDSQINQKLLAINYHKDSPPKQMPQQAAPSTASEPVEFTQAMIDEQGLHTVNLALIGVTCASCVNLINGALTKMPEIANQQGSVNINFGNRTATVVSAYPATALIEQIQAVGYDANEILDQDLADDEKAKREAQEYQAKVKHSILGLALGVPMMGYGMLGGSMMVTNTTEQLVWGVIGLACLAVLWAAGKHFFTGAWKAFTHRNANMDTLIAVGTGTAWLYSMVIVLIAPFVATEVLPDSARHLYFEAAVMIVGLINLGQALELKARGRTSQAIRRLLDLRVKTATVIRNGQAVTIPADEVQLGDQVQVKAGEKIAVDGVILEGQSHIDEAMLTGEPIPVLKQQGDPVSAGTINGQGTLIYQATKVGSETMLAQIIHMVSQAQNSKPPISQLADKVSAIFVPTVMIFAILTALAWYNFGPQPELVYMIVTATSVLIIACPCALGLATPISTMIGIGKAAEFGGLIRNGDALQKASEIKVVVLDKTGTITQGRPMVEQYHAFDPASEAFALDLIHQLELGANHPLANAIMDYIKQQQAPITMKLTEFQSLTGLGVQAVYQGKQLLLGNARLMQQFEVDLSLADTQSQAWLQQAMTLVYFALDGKLQTLFGISDPIREDAAQAIGKMQAQGIEVIMLTGDNEHTAKVVAAQVGIQQFHANLLPEDKLNWVHQLQAQGKVVGMVGDGINDAPALAQADVGFAIGSGTDVAIESADITLMRHSLHGVSDVIAVSHATMKNIKQNLWGAFFYNTLGIPIAAGVLFPITGWLLSPIIAGAAMSLSSITVVSNANRLRFYQPLDRQADPQVKTSTKTEANNAH